MKTYNCQTIELPLLMAAVAHLTLQEIHAQHIEFATTCAKNQLLDEKAKGMGNPPIIHDVKLKEVRIAIRPGQLGGIFFDFDVWYKEGK